MVGRGTEGGGGGSESSSNGGYKVSATEGKTEVLGGTGGEETEERREKLPVEMTNWERVVALVRVYFGEGMMVEETM